jgi:hypothetical protein
MPKYELTRLVFEERRSLQVSEEDFARAKEARRILLLCLNIEENFNILLENYAEFEAELLNLALRDWLFEFSGWSDRIDALHLLNRRAANLLTICRVYLEHTPQALNDVFGRRSKEAAQFKAAAGTEYDGHLGFRALEALRNYVQHRGLPIHRITFQGRWKEDGSMLEHWVIPTLNLPVIREVGGFKVAVLEELEQQPQPIDLREITREYVSCLRRLHGMVRDTIAATAEAADRVMEEFAALWADGEESVRSLGLELVARSEKDELVDHIPVLREVGKRRRYLVARNRLAGDFTKQVITNKLR